MPHGHCYLWRPSLVWLNVSSDVSIGAAYRELDGVPIVLLSARSEDAMRARLLREGAQDYLTKPCG